MRKVFGRLCNLPSFNYDFTIDNIRKLQSEEMNKCALFIVFLCGVIFASLVSVMSSYWASYTAGDDTLLGSSLGAIPAGADLELMDEGYVAMALLGAHEVDQSVTKKQTTELEDRHAEIEALNTLKAAKELVHSGKCARAGRLLEHAFTLAPRHPDVLIHYGEYLEQHRNDVVQADRMYLRALAVSPVHSRALRNRRRTRPLVEEMDSMTLNRIDNKRDDLAQIPSSSAALRRIKKEAYFQYIYHTAGIEGNTMSLAQTRMILETRLSVGGKSVMEHNEILGLDLALKYINTTLVHRVGRISLYDVLEIHMRVLGHVYVSDHVPPPPTHLQVLMEDFVEWLNSPEAQTLHPIKYAALAHYKMVFIHPFSDGNGRTARLLMNFLLMQAGYPPVIIRKQDRLMYYDCLQTANEGDTRPFVRFIAHCTEKTLDVYLWATKEALPKIGQDLNSKSEKEKKHSTLKRKESDSSSIKHGRKLADYSDIESESKEGSGKKFLFTSVDDIPLWQADDIQSEDEDSFEKNRNYIPPIVEDDILSDGEVVNSVHDYESEHDYREHLWFAGDEEKVRGTGRYSRVVIEEGIYDDAEILEQLRTEETEQNKFRFEDDDTLPRSE
ncbi:adenylyltransferase Fic-like [Homarus americanus]|uniref:Protein adenylyltransferase Fic n=1 Tax=Homarus americanus TaxID=6706 RepID=A0A8J5K6J8_HOMAM|nr:adenylyltransferase Fic-like [Homarus americanus]